MVIGGGAEMDDYSSPGNRSPVAVVDGEPLGSLPGLARGREAVDHSGGCWLVHHHLCSDTVAIGHIYCQGIRTIGIVQVVDPAL